MGLLGDELIARIRNARTWPLASEARVIAELVRWIAFRENDRDILRKEAGWDSVTERYMIDPLPERLSNAYGALLFGRHPVIKPADDADGDRLAELIRENRLHSRMRAAEHKCSSEGEVWWRIAADPIRHEAPMLTWHSRIDLIPHYVNDQLRAVAFINALDDPDDDGIVWRHFEVHDPVSVTNVLFRGTANAIGEEADLDAHDETMNLREDWEHDVGMLAGRIVNIEGDDPTLGRSDYDGIEDWFLELNECLTTGKKNRALTALQRAYGPREAVGEDGQLPEGQNFLAADATDAQWGAGGPGDKFGVLEFAFDAQALITWTNHVATTALSRRGITPQFVGQATDAEGLAQSGTALRMRLIPSTNEGNLRGGQWNDEGDTILLRMQLVDAMSVDDGGFGTSWTKAEEAPAFELGDPLPVDEVEDSMRISTLRAAAAISIEQAVRERNPEWGDDQVAEEVARIKQDQQDEMAAAGGPGGLLGGGPQEGEELPDEGTVDLGEDVTVTATEDGFEIGGLAGPSAPDFAPADAE